MFYVSKVLELKSFEVVKKIITASWLEPCVFIKKKSTLKHIFTLETYAPATSILKNYFSGV